MTNNISIIKSQIKCLYTTKQKIHINLCFKSERIHLSNAVAVITGIYPNIFTADIETDGEIKSYTFQYVDLVIHNVEIKELN